MHHGLVINGEKQRKQWGGNKLDNLQILAGSSIPLPEQDDPDQIKLGIESSVEYDGAEIVSAIGSSEFKEIFTLFIKNIQTQEIVNQRRLCLAILEKVKEVYEFEFLPTPELEHQLQMNNVYDLIKFLNYDYVDFFGDVWRYLKTDLKKVDIDRFCVNNGDKIINEIEDQLNSRDLSEMVSLFLRTYNKDNLIDWFIKSTEKKRMLIYLRIMKEKLDG
jgi:hypothetical protein